jgi:hypothetical protein
VVNISPCELVLSPRPTWANKADKRRQAEIATPLSKLQTGIHHAIQLTAHAPPFLADCCCQLQPSVVR